MLTAANCQAVNVLKTPLCPSLGSLTALPCTTAPWMDGHDYVMAQEAGEGGAI